MEALYILKKNIKNLHLDNIIIPLCTDVRHFTFSKNLLPENLSITTIMNPPFGVQKKSADKYFLEQAFSFSDVIYSIHLAKKSVQNFIFKYVQNFNWKIDYVLPFPMILEKSFSFHSKKTKKIDVHVYRFIKKCKNFI